jgi:hypothetical protein
LGLFGGGVGGTSDGAGDAGTVTSSCCDDDIERTSGCGIDLVCPVPGSECELPASAFTASCTASKFPIDDDAGERPSAASLVAFARRSERLRVNGFSGLRNELARCGLSAVPAGCPCPGACAWGICGTGGADADADVDALADGGGARILRRLSASPGSSPFSRRCSSAAASASSSASSGDANPGLSGIGGRRLSFHSLTLPPPLAPFV